MNPIFQALSQLTGGLVTDSTTLVIGLITLGFLAMAFDLLSEHLNSWALDRRSSKYSENADFWFEARRNSAKGTRNYDEADLMYRLTLRESAKARLKNGV